MNVGTWTNRRLIEPSEVAKALAITKPIPYTANGVWEATVQNVADSLGLAMYSPTRESFITLAGVEKTPDLLGQLITEGQYSPWPQSDIPAANPEWEQYTTQPSWGYSDNEEDNG